MKRKRLSSILIDVINENAIVTSSPSIHKKLKKPTIVVDFRTLPKKILKSICFLYLNNGTDILNFIVAFSTKKDSFIYENKTTILYPTVQNIKRWITTNDIALFENKDLEGIKYLHTYYKVDFSDCAHEYAIWYGNIQMMKWLYHVGGYPIKLWHLSIAIAASNLQAIKYCTVILKNELRWKIDDVIEKSVKIIKTFEKNNALIVNGLCIKTAFQKNIDTYIQLMKSYSMYQKFQ